MCIYHRATCLPTVILFLFVAVFPLQAEPPATATKRPHPTAEEVTRQWLARHPRPRDEAERSAALAAGYDLGRILTCDDLVAGDDVFFSATGVTDGDVLQGVRYRGRGATTESLVMRSRSGTVRRIVATHPLSKIQSLMKGAR